MCPGDGVKGAGNDRVSARLRRLQAIAACALGAGLLSGCAVGANDPADGDADVASSGSPDSTAPATDATYTQESGTRGGPLLDAGADARTDPGPGDGADTAFEASDATADAIVDGSVADARTAGSGR